MKELDVLMDEKLDSDIINAIENSNITNKLLEQNKSIIVLNDNNIDVEKISYNKNNIEKIYQLKNIVCKVTKRKYKIKDNGI